MKVSAIYTLSTIGQKASLISGGNGQYEQTATFEVEGADLVAFLEVADIDSKGAAILPKCDSKCEPDRASWDHIPTLTELVNDVQARRLSKATKVQAEVNSLRVKTRKVIEDRLTITQNAYPSAYRVAHVRMNPAWAHWGETQQKLVQDILDGDDAKAWVSELDSANDAAEEAAWQDKLRREAEAEAKEAARQEAIQAIRDERGLDQYDISLDIEDGALTQVPDRMWSTHKRGRNWLAIIDVDPKSPGGLSRRFAEKAKGSSYYLVPDWKPGDAIEFGADYYTGSGSKDANRWYGFVKRTCDGYVVLENSGNGKKAVKEGEMFAKSAMALIAVDTSVEDELPPDDL